MAGTSPRAPEHEPPAEDTTAFVDRLVGIALRGLRTAYVPETAEFVQTVRGLPGPTGPRLVPEGRNLRYGGMAALGLAQVDEQAQREVLGTPVGDLVAAVREQALEHPDPGAVALAVWAGAEVAGETDDRLLGRLRTWVRSGDPLPTVDLAWILTAAVAVGSPAGDDIASAAADRLLGAQGPGGTWPHAVPATSQGRLRAHVGSFADQVYPLQGLARHAAAGGGARALAAADACAERLCALQGEHGQWWWHYDARDGSVVERYPVYSVHQHAMGPMVLHDLVEAGGADHRDAVHRGLSWLRTHPESFEGLVDDAHGLVWRKVGRREPRKAVRSLNAVTTAVRPGLRLPGLDAAFPPGPVDHECRPYELGWLLYAWRRPSGLASLAGVAERAVP